MLQSVPGSSRFWVRRGRFRGLTVSSHKGCWQGWTTFSVSDRCYSFLINALVLIGLILSLSISESSSAILVESSLELTLWALDDPFNTVTVNIHKPRRLACQIQLALGNVENEAHHPSQYEHYSRYW